MAAGHDLAIEGPSATGKSETITNMIATALGAGKRVLFVAEKQAALRVVADRLRASGFGPLLLELHGETANSVAVYDGLRGRLDAKVALDPVTLASQRQQLYQQRDTLRRYLALIDVALGSIGRKVYWPAWREIRLRGMLDPAMVADALSDAGYVPVHQVGVEGFRVDLGVRYPEHPLGFVAGIECDGCEQDPSGGSSSDGAIVSPAADVSPDTAPAVAAPGQQHVRSAQPEMRSIGDSSWFETIKGSLYEVWLGDRFAGEVEVLFRATGGARLYGGGANAPR